MSKEAEFFIYLIERYAEKKGIAADAVLRQWDKLGLTDLIYNMYEIYHCERLENAFDDIDALIREKEDASGQIRKMSGQLQGAPMVRLGDYIERSMVNNADLKYDASFIEGVNSNHEFCASKANTTDINLKPYKIVNNGDFVYNPSRLNLGSIAYRTQGRCIVSHLYVVFHLNELGQKKIEPQFLFLFFIRDEFCNLVTYLNFGSQRPEFNFFEMSEIKIPLPDIEVQRELVAIYDGLQKIVAENEALIPHLEEACRAYMVDLKSKYPKTQLGHMIEDFDVKNIDNKIKAVRSVSVTKEFKETNAKVNKDELSGYKIVPPGYIAYVQTTKNEKCFANALNTSDANYVVSAVDKVIGTKDSKVLKIGFLHLLLRSKEFDRYAIFNSWGSAREIFSYEEFCKVLIPLPPSEIQEAIVDVYNCLEEAKRLVAESRELMKNLCPALVQKAAHSA